MTTFLALFNVLSWRYVAGLVVVLACSVIALLGATAYDRHERSQDALNTISAPIQDFPLLKLISHGDSSTELTLEVVNDGAPIIVSAQLRIINARTCNLYKKYGYIGKWIVPLTRYVRSNSTGRNLAQSVSIDSGKSARLLIAEVESPYAEGSAQMFLVGIDENVMWDVVPVSKQGELPFFDLEVRLFAKGHNRPIIRTYRAGPKTALGPLHMTEVA